MQEEIVYVISYFRTFSQSSFQIIRNIIIHE